MARCGRGLGTGACAEEGGLRCPGPDQRPRDWSLGRQRWCGWVGIIEATWEATLTAGGGVPGTQHLALQFLDLSRVGVCATLHLPAVLRGGLTWCWGSGQGCNRQLAAEKLVWEGVPALGSSGALWHPRVHLALAPLGSLCSKGRKATGLLPALGRGRQQRAAVMATERCVEGLWAC